MRLVARLTSQPRHHEGDLLMWARWVGIPINSFSFDIKFYFCFDAVRLNKVLPVILDNLLLELLLAHTRGELLWLV